MRKLFFKPLRFAVLGAALSAGATVAHGQSFSMQIVADNDFAVFAGTASRVTELLYQNDYSWPDQINNLSTLSFDLQNGETTFYLLGMGGGGQENISGTVNGVDITTIGDVLMSSDIGPYLTGYEAQSSGGTVADGTFDASLTDVQAAFSSLTWSAPSPNTSDAVIQLASPNGVGFDFPSQTAELFSFSTADVGVTSTPEPSATGLLLVSAGMAITAIRFRRSAPPCV
jgi:hypothetical protein